MRVSPLSGSGLPWLWRITVFLTSWSTATDLLQRELVFLNNIRTPRKSTRNEAPHQAVMSWRLSSPRNGEWVRLQPPTSRPGLITSTFSSSQDLSNFVFTPWLDQRALPQSHTSKYPSGHNLYSMNRSQRVLQWFCHTPTSYLYSVGLWIIAPCLPLIFTELLTTVILYYARTCAHTFLAHPAGD